MTKTAMRRRHRPEKDVNNSNEKTEETLFFFCSNIGMPSLALHICSGIQVKILTPIEVGRRFFSHVCPILLISYT